MMYLYIRDLTRLLMKTCIRRLSLSVCAAASGCATKGCILDDFYASLTLKTFLSASAPLDFTGTGVSS